MKGASAEAAGSVLTVQVAGIENRGAWLSADPGVAGEELRPRLGCGERPRCPGEPPGV